MAKEIIMYDSFFKKIRITPGDWELDFLKPVIVDGDKRTEVPESEFIPMFITAYAEDRDDYRHVCIQAKGDQSCKNWRNNGRLLARSKRLLMHAIMVKLWFEDQYEKGKISRDDIFFSKDLIEESAGETWENIKDFFNKNPIGIDLKEKSNG